jgi:WXG100 family type VII secretion target
MAMAGDQKISASFEGVAAGAQQIIKKAEGIRDELTTFNNKVKEYVETYGGGQANTAFSEYQTTWNQQVDHLNTTLSGAGTLVDKGNSDLQSTDKALSNLFT